MSGWTMGLGIATVLILLGIIISGSVIEGNTKYSGGSNFSKIDFDKVVGQIDTNVTAAVTTAFDNKGYAPGVPKVAYYLTKSIVYGFYTDLYLGVTINEYFPNLYQWIKDNMLLVILFIIILAYPELIKLIIIAIIIIILIIKHRIFDKKKVLHPWRTETPIVAPEKKSILGNLFKKK